MKVLILQSCLTLWDPVDCSLLFCLQNSPGKHTGVGCHALLQRLFPTQGSNLGLLHCRQILTVWATMEAPTVSRGTYKYKRGKKTRMNLVMLDEKLLKKQGIGINTQFSVCSVQFSHSVVSNSVTPWTAACQASLSITNSWSLLKLMSIESVMLSNHLIPCRPLLLLPSIFPSIRVFSNKSVFHIRWPKYWSFSFNISLSNEYLGLISFRMDWLDLLAVQGTLKSLLQHHSSKASIL